MPEFVDDLCAEQFSKYCLDKKHASQVQKLSLLLFDKTFGILHNFSNKKREKLSVAAFLHDIGHYFSEDKHNKISYDLILDQGLNGFGQRDTLIIAAIARYHRGKEPTLERMTFLPDEKAQKQVIALSSILRISDDFYQLL